MLTPWSPLTSLASFQVIDNSGARLGEYEDMSKVEKYEISEEAYEQRQSMGCPVMDGGLWGLEEVWGQAEVCAGAHRIDRDTEGKLAVCGVG